jgi:hypothetical protein
MQITISAVHRKMQYTLIVCLLFAAGPCQAIFIKMGEYGRFYSNLADECESEGRPVACSL